MRERVLRALAASVVLDIVYVIVFGPVLTDRLPRPTGHLPPQFSYDARPLALGALLLLVLVPAGTAWGASWLEYRDDAPTTFPRPRPGTRCSRTEIRALSGHGSRAFVSRGER